MGVNFEVLDLGNLEKSLQVLSSKYGLSKDAVEEVILRKINAWEEIRKELNLEDKDVEVGIPDKIVVLVADSIKYNFNPINPFLVAVGSEIERKVLMPNVTYYPKFAILDEDMRRNYDAMMKVARMVQKLAKEIEYSNDYVFNLAFWNNVPQPLLLEIGLNGEELPLIPVYLPLIVDMKEHERRTFLRILDYINEKLKVTKGKEEILKNVIKICYDYAVKLLKKDRNFTILSMLIGNHWHLILGRIYVRELMKAITSKSFSSEDFFEYT